MGWIIFFGNTIAWAALMLGYTWFAWAMSYIPPYDVLFEVDE